MKLHFLAPLATAIAMLAWCSSSALAQNSQSADFIVALVNSEPITNSELQTQIKQITEQREQQRQTLPPASELRSLVLERLVNERAQLQLARDSGLRADPVAIDQAEANLAAQNQMDIAQFRQSLMQRGISQTAFREQIRDQILLSRLHERDVESRVRVSDTDVENALAARQVANADPLAQEINLANLLVPLPEKPTPAQVTLAQTQAQRILARIRAGEEFGTLVKELSGAERSNGGQLGLRRADRYPLLFVNATTALSVGQVSEPVRSDAGFHLLLVVERRAGSLVQTMPQTRARHILLRISPQLSQAQAVARLSETRARIMAGSIPFEAAAREMSQDGSASQGGDLGWATAGMFVPEFESAMDQLKEREISQPVVSRFGVHLLQVMERRSVELTPVQVRERVRAELRAQRIEEAYLAWERDIRNRAFIEIREPR
jgi:peptidyl-prolyl cis-trans isomerase SurA